MVLALDAAAQRASLRAGMPAAKAQALVPGLIVRGAEPVAEACGFSVIPFMPL
jgi:protein ImuB